MRSRRRRHQGGGNGGISLPSRLRDLWERRKLSQRVWGEENSFGAFSAWKNTSDVWSLGATALLAPPLATPLTATFIYVANSSALGHVYKRGINVAVTFRYIPQQSRLNYTQVVILWLEVTWNSMRHASLLNCLFVSYLFESRWNWIQCQGLERFQSKYGNIRIKGVIKAYDERQVKYN